MSKSGSKLSYIFIYDPTRLISDDIRVHFKNTLKYRLENFSEVDELIQSLKKLPFGRSYTRVCIYVVNGRTAEEEGGNDRKKFFSEIRNADEEMNFICLVNKVEKDPNIRSGFPPASIIVKNNENAVLRITNHVLGIISKENLERKYLAAKRSVQLLLVFILFILGVALVSWFLFPEYFG